MFLSINHKYFYYLFLLYYSFEKVNAAGKGQSERHFLYITSGQGVPKYQARYARKGETFFSLAKAGLFFVQKKSETGGKSKNGR